MVNGRPLFSSSRRQLPQKDLSPLPSRQEMTQRIRRAVEGPVVRDFRERQAGAHCEDDRDETLDDLMRGAG
jgi:hypothetical protein